MNILSLHEDAIYPCLWSLNGIQVAKAREICKRIKQIIDKNEATLFHICMLREYPRQFLIYHIPYVHRQDWKNIYVLTDQFEVTVKRAPKHKAILKYHREFKYVDMILAAIGAAFDLVGGITGGVKVGLLGLRASRDVINAFIRANPGTNMQHALDYLRTLNL